METVISSINPEKSDITPVELCEVDLKAFLLSTFRGIFHDLGLYNLSF